MFRGFWHLFLDSIWIVTKVKFKCDLKCVCIRIELVLELTDIYCVEQFWINTCIDASFIEIS